MPQDALGMAGGKANGVRYLFAPYSGFLCAARGIQRGFCHGMVEAVVGAAGAVMHLVATPFVCNNLASPFLCY
jgi:hypothetical protein